MKKLYALLIIIIALFFINAFRDPIVNSVTEIYNKAKDAITNAIIVVDYEHHEAHQGRHWNLGIIDTDFDEADTVALIILTPNTARLTHLTWAVSGALVTFGGLYETPGSDSATGNEYTLYNNYRGHTNTIGTRIFDADANASSGTLIDPFSFGISTGQGQNSKSGGGSGRGGEEWILKPNAKYLFWVVSGADDNNLDLDISAYEHTNK